MNGLKMVCMNEKQLATEIFSELCRWIDIDRLEPDSLSVHLDIDKQVAKFTYTMLWHGDGEMCVSFNSTGLDSYKIFDHLTRIIYRENSNET